MRDGMIYKTVDDAGWIDHLALNGTNALHDKASVAIEFTNELGLLLDGDRLYALGMNTPNTVYTGSSSLPTGRASATSRRPTRRRWTPGSGGPRHLPPHDIKQSFYYPSTKFVPALFSRGRDRVT
jgi:hypothetical protein